MKLFELLESGPATSPMGQDKTLTGSATLSGVGRYSAEDDEVNKIELGDTRKPKVTLRALNKLKMIRAAKKLEIMQKTKVLGIMYGAAPEEDGGSPI